MDDLASFKSDAQVLVVGNATVDETFVLPSLPEAGESVTGCFRMRDIGGKGLNVATIFSRCGLATQLTTAVGKDDRGSFITETLSAESLELDVVVSENHGTDLSLIYSAPDGENSIVSTVQAAQSLDHVKALQAIDSLQERDVLVLQSNLTESLTGKLIEYANRIGAFVVFNPSPFAPWVKKLIPDVDVVFVNIRESYQLTGTQGDQAVVTLLNQGPGQVVLTCGKSGAYLGTRHTEDGHIVKPVLNHVAAIASTVRDTTGAGDTYLAVAIASACIRGTSVDATALMHAAKAAAITIERYGTFSAFPDESMLAAILSGEGKTR